MAKPKKLNYMNMNGRRPKIYITAGVCRPWKRHLRRISPGRAELISKNDLGPDSSRVGAYPIGVF